MRSDFVRDTTEYDLRSYSHLVKHLNKITLMKLTITSTLAPIFLLSLGSTVLSPVGTFNQMSGCSQPQRAPNLSYLLSTYNWSSPGSLFQLKVLLLFIQFSRGDPVLPIISLDCPFLSGSCHSNHTAQAFPSSAKSYLLPPCGSFPGHISHTTLTQKPLLTPHCPKDKIQIS